MNQQTICSKKIISASGDPTKIEWLKMNINPANDIGMGWVKSTFTLFHFQFIDFNIISDL